MENSTKRYQVARSMETTALSTYIPSGITNVIVNAGSTTASVTLANPSLHPDMDGSIVSIFNNGTANIKMYDYAGTQLTATEIPTKKFAIVIQSKGVLYPSVVAS